MISRAMLGSVFKVFPLGVIGFLLLGGEGCTPPATQSVYYAPSTSTNSFANFPMGNPSSALVVQPVGTLAIGSQTTLNVSGGTPPYRYNILTPNGGTLAGNVYTAPNMAGLIQIAVGDSGGQAYTLTITVTNSTVTTTGTGTGQPMTFDVYTQPVCNGYYCTCGSTTQPGVPNQAAAQAICTSYGYSTLTAYTITDGPTGTYQCDPTTGQCYYNVNAKNIVCVTVTCQ